MDNNLNNFFVTFYIYKEGAEVHSMIVPKSLIHDMFQKWIYPGSKFSVKIIDSAGKLRIQTG